MKDDILKRILLTTGILQMMSTSWAMDHNTAFFDIIVEDNNPFKGSGWEENYWDYPLTFDVPRKNEQVNQELDEIESKFNGISTFIPDENRKNIYNRLVELSMDPDNYWTTNLKNKFLRAKLTIFAGKTPMSWEEAYETFAQVAICHFMPDNAKLESLYSLAYMRFSGKSTQLSWEETEDLLDQVSSNSNVSEVMKTNVFMYKAAIRFENHTQRITDQEAFDLFHYVYKVKPDNSVSKAACAYYMGMLILSNRYPVSSYMAAYEYFNFASQSTAFNIVKSIHATFLKALVAEQQQSSVLSPEELYKIYLFVSEHPKAHQSVKNKALVRLVNLWIKHKIGQMTPKTAFNLLEPAVADSSVREEGILLRGIISFTYRLEPRNSNIHYQIFSELADGCHVKQVLQKKAQLYKMLAGLSKIQKPSQFIHCYNELEKMYNEYVPASTSQCVAGLGLLYMIAENKVVVSNPTFPFYLANLISKNSHLPLVMKTEAHLLEARLFLKEGVGIEARKNAYTLSQKYLEAQDLPDDLKHLAQRNMQDLIAKITSNASYFL